MTVTEAMERLRYEAKSQVCSLTPKECGEIRDVLEAWWREWEDKNTLKVRLPSDHAWTRGNVP